MNMHVCVIRWLTRPKSTDTECWLTLLLTFVSGTLRYVHTYCAGVYTSIASGVSVVSTSVMHVRNSWIWRWRVRITYIALDLCILPSAVVSSPREPAYSLGRSPSPWTLSFAVIELHVALVCHLNGLHLRNPYRYMDWKVTCKGATLIQHHKLQLQLQRCCTSQTERTDSL